MPTDLRPFIGREEQLKQLTRQIASPECRILLIHGPGGMGKTRIACEVGRQRLGDYPGGVWFIECDGLAGGQQLLAAIAAGVGADSSSTLGEICEHLSDARTLLIVDCFERLVDHYGVLRELARQCPAIQILITSRILPEGCPKFELTPLSGHRRQNTSERLALFESAVRTIRPEFRITRSNAQVCRDIARMLEGVPLAILLAAGRLRHIGLEELRDRLQKSLLATLKRLGPASDRHASLQIVVSDSFSLLESDIQKLAMKLSVFAGGFTLAAAQEVLSEDGVEEGVFVLCDHALLTVNVREPQARYRSLDTIREFLSDEAKILDLRPDEERFLAHYTDLAVSSDSLPREPRDVMPELRNYQKAVRLAAAWGDEARLNRLAAALARPFAELGLDHEFDLMLSQLEGAGDRRALELLGLKGMLARRAADFAASEAAWWRRADLAKALTDYEKEADACMDLADLGMHCGNLALARKAVARAAPLLDRIGLGLVLGIAMLRAKLNLADGERDAALAEVAFIESRREDLDEADRMFTTNGLAEIRRELGDRDGAEREIRQMLSVAFDAAKAHSAARGILTLAELRDEASDTEYAISLCLIVLRGGFLSKPMLARARRLLAKFDAASGKKAQAVLEIDEWLGFARSSLK